MIDSKIINSKTINFLIWLLAGILSAVIITNVVVKKPIVHNELLHTMPQLVNHDGESFFKGLYAKTFDLNIVEASGYRPRALGFLIGYIEPNLIISSNQISDKWGIRQPLVYVGAILFLTMFVLLLRLLFPSLPYSACWLIGISSLFFANIQTSLYVFHGRSAKVLAFSAVLVLIYFFINMKDKTEELKHKNIIYSILLIAGFFILSTLDEMVLASLACLTGISIVISIIRKEINYVAVIFLSSFLVYISYYLWWGRAIFEHFTTTQIIRHTHSIEKLYESISIDILYQAVRSLYNSFSQDYSETIIKVSPTGEYNKEEILGSMDKAMVEVFYNSLEILNYVAISLFNNKILLAIVAFTFVVYWIWLKLEDKIISILFLASGFAITVVSVASHLKTYLYKDVWSGSYFVIPMLFILFAWLYVLAKSNFRYNKVAPLLVLFCITTAGVFNSLSIDKYYGIFLKKNGGHLDPIADESYHKLGSHIDPDLFKNVWRE